MARRKRETTGPAEPQRGIACPACGAPIPVRVDQLLGAVPIACGHCGLALTIDTERSAAALEIVQRVADAMRQVEAVKHQRL